MGQVCDRFCRKLMGLSISAETDLQKWNLVRTAGILAMENGYRHQRNS
jgi:hypothetical protein